jgi:methionyl-tRNA formyltransferase
MSKVRVCFLGTTDFAVTCLKSIYEDEHFEIVGVVTQPDRPSGRKLLLTPTPVKSFALAKGLKVISPDDVKSDLILQEIQRWNAEAAVVVAFGQILPQAFLDLFAFGAVNVHASLLPKWRGAAPIQRSLEMGENETGVTLQKVVKALDAGDIIGTRKISVGLDEQAPDIFNRLAVGACDLLHVELMDYIRGNLAPVRQDEALKTYAKKIDKAESELKWNLTAREIHNRVRAFAGGPGTWVSFQNKKLKIHRTKLIDETSKKAPGQVVKLDRESFWVATQMGLIALLEVQPESRNRMSIEDFLKGYSFKEGDQIV